KIRSRFAPSAAAGTDPAAPASRHAAIRSASSQRLQTQIWTSPLARFMWRIALSVAGPAISASISTKSGFSRSASRRVSRALVASATISTDGMLLRSFLTPSRSVGFLLDRSNRISCLVLTGKSPCQLAALLDIDRVEWLQVELHRVAIRVFEIE